MEAVKIVPQTDQDAFDMAVRRLGELPELAMDSKREWCSYVAGCAVGCMVESVEDRKRLDAAWEIVDRLCVGGLLDVGDVSLDMLQRLQCAHDNAQNWGEGGFKGWEQVRRIAAGFGLSTDVLEGVSS